MCYPKIKVNARTGGHLYPKKFQLFVAIAIKDSAKVFSISSLFISTPQPLNNAQGMPSAIHLF
jgi:hypothetical protein